MALYGSESQEKKTSPLSSCSPDPPVKSSLRQVLSGLERPANSSPASARRRQRAPEHCLGFTPFHGPVPFYFWEVRQEGFFFTLPR